MGFYYHTIVRYDSKIRLLFLRVLLTSSHHSWPICLISLSYWVHFPPVSRWRRLLRFSKNLVCRLLILPPIAQSLTFLSSLSFLNVSLLSSWSPIFPFTNFFLQTSPASGPVTLLNLPLLRSSLTFLMLSIVVTPLSLHCSICLLPSTPSTTPSCSIASASRLAFVTLRSAGFGRTYPVGFNLFVVVVQLPVSVYSRHVSGGEIPPP